MKRIKERVTKEWSGIKRLRNVSKIVLAAHVAIVGNLIAVTVHLHWLIASGVLN